MRCFTLFIAMLTIGLVKSMEDSLDNNKETDSDPTIAPRKAGRGQIRFEDDPQYPDLDDSYVNTDGQISQPLRFEDSNVESPGRVTFQEDNRIEDLDNYSANSEDNVIPTKVIFQDDNRIPDPGTTKKRRRRRRKPRYQLQGQYTPGAPMPLGGPNYPGYPLPYPGAGLGIGPGGPIGQYYRPIRRPKPSFASEALSKVSGALTSIALYDDYQCVPRLLCEAAGGGALGTSPVIQSIAGLQPLLTLLAAYNGISTSPLFVFGRAVFLGMTSKGNTASCRYAYPQCPTDPEELVHYLNNHNGGFFRFFNSPQPQIPQNVEQFYNQLSGQYGVYQNPGTQQNFGFYGDPMNQVSQNQNGPYQPNLGVPQNGLFNPQSQQYGYYQPYPQNSNPQNLYQPNYSYPQPSYENPQGNQQYGLHNQYVRPQNPYSYGYQNNYGHLQKYGPKYPYIGKYGLDKVRYKDKLGKTNQIEKRIQNKPSYLYIDNNVGNVDVNPKWIFPENYVNTDDKVANNVRGGKNLKFPEESVKIDFDTDHDRRKGKDILFPDSQNTKYANYYEYPPISNNDNKQQYYAENTYLNNNYNKIYNYDSTNNRFAQSPNFGINHFYANSNVYSSNGYSKYMYSNEDEGVKTVYIVRGNGDPNHPEIVKVRPGEKVML